MKRPDVIVAWPRHCDYPLWRQFIRDERERFGRVLVVFTEHDGADYSGFVSEVMPEAECFWSPPRGERDWRDVAVNAALDRSDAEWVWFTEQDFLITDREAFFALDGARGWWDAYRWHPSSLLLPREDIERTSRYFGPVPLDHFARFCAELPTEVCPIPPGLFEHLQGVSHNHWLAETGGSLFRPERFVRYLADSLAAPVPLHPDWVRAATHYMRGGVLSTSPRSLRRNA